MIRCLNPATTGEGRTLRDFLRAASRHGFAAVDYDIGALGRIVEHKSIEAVRDLFASTNVELASFRLPVEFRKDEATFRQSIAQLPRFAAMAANIGCRMCCTWLPPSTESPVAAFTCQVIRRLRECAQALADQELRLAIEWVGPATARTLTHDFIHTLEGDMDLIAAVNQPNVGLLFDSFHWFTSSGSIPDIEAVPGDLLYYVHVSDAPDKPLDQQVTLERLLPGEGIIDWSGMLGALKNKGYDRHVSVEVFDKELQAMGLDAAAQRAKVALDKVLAGL
jgi:sugar phosphate isomerase/epimerase